MTNNTRMVAPEDLMPQLPTLLQEAESIPLVITGNSMVPFLVHGRDTVYLSRVPDALRRGDMILYRRRTGAYVLHRILRAQAGVYTLVGDAQTAPEPGIRQEQVLALVTAVRRKGRLLQKGSFLWDFFEKTWLWLRPVRPLLVKTYTFFRKRTRRPA